MPSATPLNPSAPVPRPPGESYWPQLDALRAFAVLAVMATHFSGTVHAWVPELGTGAVRLFFVLSGFLITGILLRCRGRVAAGVSTMGFQLRQFYLRRSLRIFPAFYGTLFLAAALNMEAMRPTFWWHFFYASNFLVASRNAWIGIVSHFWSLAVEEQFYLFWPWLILFTPQRRLPLLLGLVCAIGPITRAVVLFLAPDGYITATVLTPACLDQLGAGAVLAWLWHTRGAAAALPARWRTVGLLLLVVAVPAELLLCSVNFWSAVFAPTLQAIAFVALIDGAARGFRGAVGSVLLWRPLLWIGQISYGLYLLHNFSHWWAPRILRQLTRYRLSYFPNEFLHVLFLTALSFGAAITSWYLLERPLNRLKSRLGYAA